MTPATSKSPRSVDVRSRVVEVAVGLFDEHGFEATSVEDIARAAGVSRSTYFRQFGGKEDAVFADHGLLLEELKTWMDVRSEQAGDVPWVTVCEASKRVFTHLSEDLDLARRRYQVVREVPALRDREIVTERRYEQLFARFLRQSVPGLDPVDAIGFAALITATHNYFLRQAVLAEDFVPAGVAELPQGAEPPEGALSTPSGAEGVTARSAAELERALVTVRRRFGVAGSEDDGGGADHPAGGPHLPAGSQVVVATFPTSVPSGEVIRRVQEALGQDGATAGE